MAQKYTHDQLVNMARKWLSNRSPDPCVVVVTEMTTSMAMECPDAIGFLSHGRSVLVECKATQDDFASDRSKVFRANPYLGMGYERYYLTPPNLVSLTEVPEGWGLLERRGRGIGVVLKSAAFADYNQAAEAALLVSSLRRLYRRGDGGVRVRCYAIDTAEGRPRATLGVVPESLVVYGGAS